MQLKLPLFPTGCILISDCLGVYEKDGLVQYIVNGLPVYAHPKDDLKAFRYITSNSKCYITDMNCLLGGSHPKDC